MREGEKPTNGGTTRGGAFPQRGSTKADNGLPQESRHFETGPTRANIAGDGSVARHHSHLSTPSTTEVPFLFLSETVSERLLRPKIIGKVQLLSETVSERRGSLDQNRLDKFIHLFFCDIFRSVPRPWGCSSGTFFSFLQISLWEMSEMSEMPNPPQERSIRKKRRSS